MSDTTTREEAGHRRVGMAIERAQVDGVRCAAANAMSISSTALFSATSLE
jgi:hypothetical protein